MISETNLQSYRVAFDNFRKETKEVESAILKSTKTNGCSLELFEDATYRILCDDEIGNCYKSPGIIISIPKLDCDDYDDEYGQHFFDNAMEEMDWIWEETIESAWEDYLTALSDKKIEEQEEDYWEDYPTTSGEDWIDEQDENYWNDYLAELSGKRLTIV